MNENNITVTLTESQHEMLVDLLTHGLEAINFVSPYNDGMWDLPLDNPIIQRYTMMDNMKEMLVKLWVDRFNE